MSKYPAPPPSKRGDTATTLYGIRVEDPYRWLENGKDPEVQAWVKAQNAYTRKILDALPARAQLENRFAELMYLDAVSPPLERGGQLFYTRREKALEKPRLMVRPKTSQAASGAAASANGHANAAADHAGERVLIDANTLSSDGSVSLGSWFPSWDGKQVVYALHENNADEATLHLRDVATGKDSAIDVISGAKYAHPKWTPDNKGFYYEWLPTDPSIPVAERPGRTELRFHRLGTDPKTDPTVFPATLDPKTFLAGQLSHDGRWLIVNVQRGWQRTTIFVRDLQKNPHLTPVHASAPAASGQSGEARAAASARELGFTPLVTDQDAIFNVEWWKG
ncbi:MAG TPA: hypothetical protein VG963_08830, partial [Polyangiaceae bacterium]|nr:hypothetical protein [Polyangiaceae bacterium]